MKQEITSRYVRRITIRLKPEEFEKLQRHYKSTTCRKLSEFARKILLGKPVVVNYRNQSAVNYLKIKRDIGEIIKTEMERMMNTPEMEGLIVKK